MKKMSVSDKKRVGDLKAQIKELQTKLVKVNKLEGKDSYLTVIVDKNQARFVRVKQKGTEDKAVGKFFLRLAITATQQDVFVPISVASGKKTAGFMYQIEGSAPGSIVTTDIEARGDGVSHVTVGTLLYAKIPSGKTGVFDIQATIRGAFNKRYKIVFTRLNYKLNLTDARYQQYLKPISSDGVLFS